MKIEPFNDHKNCSGHANYMLDSTYEDKDDRELLTKVLSYYIEKNEKELAQA